jgi:endonuclease-3 related protein
MGKNREMKKSVHLEEVLKKIYDKLFATFGPQGWWPASSPFEVAIGAILTQNTNWKNVEKAINNLKKHNLLSPKKLKEIDEKKLSILIKSAGYYNQKAKKIKEFVKFLVENYNGKMEEMKKENPEDLREKLLSIKGIGRESADSILLYALDMPVFVVDAYTYRIMLRHGLIYEDITYDELKELFEKNLPHDVKIFNEYHALLVKLGKEFCKKSVPKCNGCPLEEFLEK